MNTCNSAKIPLLNINMTMANGSEEIKQTQRRVWMDTAGKWTNTKQWEKLGTPKEMAGVLTGKKQSLIWGENSYQQGKGAKDGDWPPSTLCKKSFSLGKSSMDCATAWFFGICSPFSSLFNIRKIWGSHFQSLNSFLFLFLINTCFVIEKDVVSVSLLTLISLLFPNLGLLLVLVFTHLKCWSNTKTAPSIQKLMWES